MNPFLLQVRQVLVDRGERREAEAPADFLETGRVAVLIDEFVQIIEDFALPFRERKHKRPSMTWDLIRKRKAKVKATWWRRCTERGNPKVATDELLSRCRTACGFRFPFPGPATDRLTSWAWASTASTSSPWSRGTRPPTASSDLQRFAQPAGRPDFNSHGDMCRLGWRTRCISRFGADEWGTLSRRSLRVGGVDVSRRKPSPPPPPPPPLVPSPGPDHGNQGRLEMPSRRDACCCWTVTTRPPPPRPQNSPDGQVSDDHRRRKGPAGRQRAAAPHRRNHRR